MIHLQTLSYFVITHPFAIIVCMLVYMGIGMMWYSGLFAKPWAKMTGMDKISKEKAQKAMWPAMGTSLATAFVQSVVMGRTFQILDMSHWAYPLVIATVLWFPFVFMVMAQGYAYTLKSWKLLLIDSGYMLVSMWVMALILWSAVS